MRILPRDIDLFRYLHTVKVATFEQINRDVYPDHKLQSIRNRLAAPK